MMGWILGVLLIGQTTVIIQPVSVATCTMPANDGSLSFGYNYDPTTNVLLSVDVSDDAGDTVNCPVVQQVNVSTVSMQSAVPTAIATVVPTPPIQVPATDTPVPTDVPSPTPTSTATV